ncbi:MAG: HdeD family acid-resistance protein [Candidatus Geothermincolia bacterium]
METNETAEQEGMQDFSKLWWIWLVLGIAWVIISLVVLRITSASVTVVGVIVGIFLLVVGIQEFLVAAVSEGWKWLWIIFGVLFVIAGIFALAYPKNTFTAVANILGFIFLLVGIFWIVQSLATKEVDDLWWFGLIAGLLLIILAFWTAGQFFVTKAYTLLVFAGIFGLIHGVMDIVRSFQIKKIGKEMLP